MAITLKKQGRVFWKTKHQPPFCKGKNSLDDVSSKSNGNFSCHVFTSRKRILSKALVMFEVVS